MASSGGKGGDVRTKDGYPLWTDSPEVAAGRTLALLESLSDAGVTVDQWADAIGRSGDRARRWINKRDATNYLTDEMVAATCELLHIDADRLATYYEAGPFVESDAGTSGTAPTRYTPEELVRAYAMLDAQEQVRVTGYVADLFSIHRLRHENERIRHEYENRLDWIDEAMGGPLMDPDATVDDFRAATVRALQPPYLSDGYNTGIDRPTLDGAPMLDRETFERRFKDVHDRLLPNGRPPKGTRL